MTKSILQIPECSRALEALVREATTSQAPYIVNRLKGDDPNSMVQDFERACEEDGITDLKEVILKLADAAEQLQNAFRDFAMAIATKPWGKDQEALARTAENMTTSECLDVLDKLGGLLGSLKGEKLAETLSGLHDAWEVCRHHTQKE